MADKRFASGDEVPPLRWFRDMIAKVAATAIEAVAPLYGEKTPAGYRLSYLPEPEFDAILTGPSGAGYNATEARLDPVTKLWTSIGGRTVVAYEYNLDSSVPLGACVRVRHTEADDWRFLLPRDGTRGGSGCASLPRVAITVNAVCCPSPAATVTLTHSGDTVGSCVIPASGVAAGGTCTMSVDLPPGTVIDYLVSAAPYPDRSGSVTIPACGQVVSVGVTWQIADLYSTLTLTDPLGNAITMTASGSTFVGSKVYTFNNIFGIPVTFTIGYTFNSPVFGNCYGPGGGFIYPQGTCNLVVSWRSDGGCPAVIGDSSPGWPALLFAGFTGGLSACSPLLASWGLAGYASGGFSVLGFTYAFDPPGFPNGGPLSWTLTP